MASKGLLTASIAAGLLVVSVGFDLAFDSSLRIEAGVGSGPMQLVGEGAIDGRYDRPMATVDPFVANGSDVMTIKITMQNGYPWSSAKSFSLSLDGCYEGARVLAVVDVSAPARGSGSGTTEIAVSRLLAEAGRFIPKESTGPGAGTQYVYLQVCRGDTYATSANLPIQEVAR